MRKSPSETSILNSLPIPPEILEAIAAADAALAIGPRTSEAIKNNAANIVIAQSEYKAAEEALAQAEAFAVTCDDSDLPKANLAVTGATKKVEEKHLVLKRAERLSITLKANAQTIDFNVRQARENLDAAIAVTRSEMVRAISAEISDAAKPLLAVLFKARALMMTMPDRELGNAMGDVQIPNPLSCQHMFIQGDLLSVDGRGERISRNWENDPAAVELFERFKPIAEVRQRLGSHVPFRDTQPASKHGYTISGNRGAHQVTEAAPTRTEPAAQELNMALTFIEGMRG